LRKPLIVANWKMNKTISDALQFVAECKRLLKDISVHNVDIILSPPFTSIKAVYDAVNGENIYVAAQNLYWEEKGAFTGEVSAPMLKDCGCTYAIIGHSERRNLFGETDEGINKKIRFAIHTGLNPIFCIGESLQQREEEETFRVIRDQVEKGLNGLNEEAFSSLLIAYEPVWAIGTGKNATAEQAEEIHGFIRSIIRESYGRSVSEALRILYGGSVTPDNICELIREHDIDGALVGGASLKADSFVKIVVGAIGN